MANYRTANVIVVDTTDSAFQENLEICGIKYIAGSGSPSVSIKGGGSSGGSVLYEEDGTTDKFEQVYIKDARGVHLTLSGTGTKVFLYLK